MSLIPGIVASQEDSVAGAGPGEVQDFANVAVLCSFDGVDGATATTDDSSYAHTATFNGSAQLDTAWFAFDDGVSSLLCNASGAFVTFPNHSVFQIGAALFTIEFVYRFASVSGSQHIVGVFDTAGGSPQKSWRVRYSASNGGMSFNYSINGTIESDSNVFAPGGGFVINTDYRICIERDAAFNLRAYIDGVMVDKQIEFTHDFFDSVKVLSIGSNPDGSSFMRGHIDELRIVINEALYANDDGYVVATEPFPRS